jgi:hypothetical protein
VTQQLISAHTCAGAFDSVDGADRAIRLLLSAGFSRDQLAVVCPAKRMDHFLRETPQTEAPAPDAVGVLAAGGALGATLGGLALAATALTGGAAGLVTAAVYIGGGAFAGGFSNLIVSKGYEQEADDDYKLAIQRGQIVVGVEFAEGDQLAVAQRILDIAGALWLKTR